MEIVTVLGSMLEDLGVPTATEMGYDFLNSLGSLFSKDVLENDIEVDRPSFKQFSRDVTPLTRLRASDGSSDPVVTTEADWMKIKAKRTAKGKQELIDRGMDTEVSEEANQTMPNTFRILRNKGYVNITKTTLSRAIEEAMEYGSSKISVLVLEYDKEIGLLEFYDKRKKKNVLTYRTDSGEEIPVSEDDRSEGESEDESIEPMVIMQKKKIRD